METGYGHTTARVAAVGSAATSAELLSGYHEETYAQTMRLVSAVTDSDLYLDNANRLSSEYPREMTAARQAGSVRPAMRRRR